MAMQIAQRFGDAGIVSMLLHQLAQRLALRAVERGEQHFPYPACAQRATGMFILQARRQALHRFRHGRIEGDGSHGLGRAAVERGRRGQMVHQLAQHQRIHADGEAQ